MLKTNQSCSILKEHGIEVVVDLPFVGENLQDQTTTDMFYASNNSTNATGAGGYAGYFSVDDVFGDDLEALNKTVAASIKQYAELTANVSGVIDRSVTERFFQAQYDLIFKNKLPISEIIVTPSSTGPVNVEYWGLLPFSRGSIHINSDNASAQASINPNYFMLEYDIRQQIATAKMARRFANTAPFSSSVSDETTPGLSAVPENASDDDWAKWLKSTCKLRYPSLNQKNSKADERETLQIAPTSITSQQLPCFRRNSVVWLTPTLPFTVPATSVWSTPPSFRSKSVVTWLRRCTLLLRRHPT